MLSPALLFGVIIAPAVVNLKSACAILPPTLHHPHVLLLGDATRPEFHELAALIRGHVLHSRLCEVPDVATARALLPIGGTVPELVIVCQSWSDEFSPSEVRALLAWLPLARLICCYGPWCDSDGRTRDTWPLAVRLSVDEALREVGAVLGGRSVADPQTGQPATSSLNCDALWKRLPLTASRTEIYADRFTFPRRRAEVGFTCQVESPDLAWRGMVESFLKSRGGIAPGAGRAAEPRDGRAVFVFDADPTDACRIAELVELRSRNEQGVIVVAVGFPRLDLEDRLRRAGADCVWPKLSPLEELFDRVERCWKSAEQNGSYAARGEV